MASVKPEDTSSLGIGTDQWVEQHEKRIGSRAGISGKLLSIFQKIPVSARYGLLIVVAFAFGTLVQNEYVLRIAVNLGVFLILTYGLNIVMGFAGLLDLGYVAFFGFGAYQYALLSSDHLNTHLPTIATIPIIVVSTALLGLLVSLPSRRLFGDYLAIVTLFFGQVFVQLVLASDSITFPWAEESKDFTGGSNGIPGLDSFKFFGFEFSSIRHYYWFTLVVLVFLTIAITRVDRTRIGRAWRTIREDPLASESMGISINNLKTLAFVAGAALAGFAGSIYAGVQLAVFVNGFDVPLLTLIYAAVILGGSGSIPGAIMGAFIMSVLPEVLRVPEYSEIMFITVLVLALIALSKSVKRFLASMAALLLTGLVGLFIFQLFGVKRALDETWAIGPVSKIMKDWLFVPENQIFWGNISFVLLIAAIAYYTTASKKIKMIALPIIGYLAIFLWEVRLIANPSATRQLIIGALLIVLMIVRPQGFLGKARVEVL
jgi:branched-chain amino acid transport system permease protein